MDTELLMTLGIAAVFALVHLFAGKLRFLEGIPRSRWLSAAGGVSVAYVFLHMLPELSARQDQIGERMAEGTMSELLVYLVALVGLAAFYGLERAAAESRTGGKGSAEATSPGIFWLHLGSFAAYNIIVTYLLLHREEGGWAALAFYALAMALHFVVNDYGLREHHKHRYHTPGRWILVGAVLMGWCIGAAVTVSPHAVTLLFAFLSGGIVMNVLKEELPEERQSRFSAFLLGCAGYAMLLLIAA